MKRHKERQEQRRHLRDLIETLDAKIDSMTTKLEEIQCNLPDIEADEWAIESAGEFLTDSLIIGDADAAKDSQREIVELFSTLLCVSGGPLEVLFSVKTYIEQEAIDSAEEDMVPQEKFRAELREFSETFERCATEISVKLKALNHAKFG